MAIQEETYRGLGRMQRKREAGGDNREGFPMAVQFFTPAGEGQRKSWVGIVAHMILKESLLSRPVQNPQTRITHQLCFHSSRLQRCIFMVTSRRVPASESGEASPPWWKEVRVTCEELDRVRHENRMIGARKKDDKK